MAELTINDLKKQADELGIKYLTNISAKDLLEKIEQAEQKLEESDGLTLKELKKEANDLGIRYPATIDANSLLQKIEDFKKLNIGNVKDAVKCKKELEALHRVIITPNNPNMTSLPASYFAFSNQYVTKRKAILFGTPIFVEKCILNLIANQKYIKATQTNKKERPSAKLLPAYNIEYLPMPTEAELEEMKVAKMRKDDSLREI